MIRCTICHREGCCESAHSPPGTVVFSATDHLASQDLSFPAPPPPLPPIPFTAQNCRTCGGVKVMYGNHLFVEIHHHLPSKVGHGLMATCAQDNFGPEVCFAIIPW